MYKSAVKIRFDFTFFAVVAFVAFFDTDGTAILSLIACLLHEFGHLIAMKICGITPERITFYGGGISLSKNLEMVSFGKRFLILICGCTVNALLAFICFVLGYFNESFMIFGAVNLVLCIFNLIPLGYFDGAEILSMFLERVFSLKTALILKKLISIFLCFLIFIVIAIYAFSNSGRVNLSLAFVMLYLILAQFVS